MAKSKIIGVGLYAPGEPIDHEELMKLTGVEFNAEKITGKIGIKTRHIAKLRGLEETTADFVTKATEEAIKDAGIDPKEVGLFVVGSDTPEYISPATAVVLQGRIQGQEQYTGAFDVAASCASFVTAYDVVARMQASDETMKYAVVVGVYNMTAFVKDGDAFGYSIFADGAGAFVLERVSDDDPSGYITGQLLSDGTQWDYIGVFAGGTKKPVTHEMLDNGDYGLQLLKPLPGERNVKLWPPLTKKLLAKANLTIDDVDHLVFTQINKSVIEQVMDKLELPMEKTTCIMDRYGYTGSGCIPMAFYHAVKEGKVKRGDKVVLVASGSGLAVGSNVFIY